ncbi:LIVCS family branched-chain amino acid:cation transporter [Garciella nitratireducens]|nr:branched-chain amino acid transport system II carrier protein [Garciella nitratireducens]RBP44946.1 LIVCS family branched-chain amino acid:cation transporter [Garciella nitratireducens]
MLVKKIRKDSLTIGFALFATFFGAGNLIFPPALGLQSGNSWFSAILGLLLSGILIPVVGIIVISYTGGSTRKLTKPIGENFYKWFILAITLFLTFVAIPRTGAVATEMGIQAIFPKVPRVISIIAFFIITYYFANDKSNVVDKIGNILTPILLIILLLIVFKGILTPIATPIKTPLKNSFATAFIGGYQTGDLLASFMIASIFLSDIARRGYISDKERNKVTINAGIIAILGLLIVYGGLLYIGATGSSLFSAETERVELLLGLVDKILGRIGIVGLAISVTLACLTTSIGLTSSVSDYFNELFDNKISYETLVKIICIFGIFIGLLGVEKIVAVTNPVFIVLYPVSIVILLLGLFHKFIPNQGSYKGAVFATLIISIIEALSSIGVKSTLFDNIIFLIPFSKQGFGWILPAIIGFIGGTFMFKEQFEISKIKEEHTEKTEV